MEDPVNILIKELKIKIIHTLNFEDITPDDIVEDHPLVGGELGIDSIDVLELVMMIDKDYGIKIDNKELGEKVFVSLTSLARFIYENSRSVGN
ncbi:MAG: acyl carrier protein [Deltaproteobacteria bacterium]|nr:acyl carrier protein [Deltaproteobacteria bacterium]